MNMKREGILLVLVAVVLLSTLGGCETGITHITDSERKLMTGEAKIDEPKAEPTKVPVKTDGTRSLESPIFLGTNLPTIKDGDHDLGITLDFTYATSHMWKGFDLFPNNRSAFYTSADIDFWGTGFGMNFLWARPFGSGYEDWEWLVYSPYYYNALWQDTPYQMDYRLGWRYYNYPDGPANSSCVNHPYDLDIQRVYGRFSWPRVCSRGFVPYYECAAIWPDEGGKYDDGCSKSYWNDGWFHTFGISKGWMVPGFFPCQPEQQVIHTGFEIVYNDGVGSTPDSVDSGWSHCVFSLSTEFYLRPNITFIPAIYYQSSWEDSVNEDDECWATMSVRLTF